MITMTTRQNSIGPLDYIEDQRAIVQDVVSMRARINGLEKLNHKIFQEVQWWRKQLFDQHQTPSRQQQPAIQGYAQIRNQSANTSVSIHSASNNRPVSGRIEYRANRIEEGEIIPYVPAVNPRLTNGRFSSPLTGKEYLSPVNVNYNTPSPRLLSVLSRCDHCARLRAKAATAPTGLLPTFRTTPAPPFTFIGVDFFGPLIYKKKRKQFGKRYGMMITCAVTRAVHIELLEGISTEDVWNGLRRVFARRGLPKLVYSDNGRSFVRVAKDIKLLNQAIRKVPNSAIDYAELKFSAPLAPWQGGFFEKMIGIFKGHFESITHKHLLPEQELITLSTEIEAIINSRPLTTMPDGTTLSPGHFLCGRRPISIPQINNKQLRNITGTLKNFLIRQRTLNGFWRTWRRAYLTKLRGRFSTPGDDQESIRVGTKVLVHDETAKRGEWPVATVIEEMPGADRCTRIFKISIAGKE